MAKLTKLSRPATVLKTSETACLFEIDGERYWFLFSELDPNHAYSRLLDCTIHNLSVSAAKASKYRLLTEDDDDD